MCFDLTSSPPIAPSGAQIAGESLIVQADDGNSFCAYFAPAPDDATSRIIVLPDARGLHRYYAELALRFAEIGTSALAIDLFGRTAGTDPRPDDFDFMSHNVQTRYAGQSADVRAAHGTLVSRTGGADIPTFVVGFCAGGRLALNASTLGLGLAGVIGFYGWPTGPARSGDSPAPTDVAPEFTNPVLALFGGADQGIPAEAVTAFEEALVAAGVENEVVTYPNAPHSFFDRKAEEFASESADAWERVQAFIGAISATR